MIKELIIKIKQSTKRNMSLFYNNDPTIKFGITDYICLNVIPNFIILLLNYLLPLWGCLIIFIVWHFSVIYILTSFNIIGYGWESDWNV